MFEFWRIFGRDFEVKFNKEYGLGMFYYEDFCFYIRKGLEEGWVVEIELDGCKYCCGKIFVFFVEIRFCSIIIVFIDS